MLHEVCLVVKRMNVNNQDVHVGRSGILGPPSVFSSYEGLLIQLVS